MKHLWELLMLLLTFTCCNRRVDDAFITKSVIGDFERIPLSGEWQSLDENHSIFFMDTTYLYSCSRPEQQVLPYKGAYFLRKKDSVLFIADSLFATKYKTQLTDNSLAIIVGKIAVVTFFKEQ